MKKVRWGRLGFIIGVINTLALVACSGILQYVPTPKLDAPSKEVIVRMAGRQAGFEVAQRYPGRVADALLKASELFVVDPSVAMMGAITNVFDLLGEKDPLFAAQVSDFVSLIKFEGPEISEEDKAIMKAALSGLIQGLRLGGATTEEGGTRWEI